MANINHPSIGGGWWGLGVSLRALSRYGMENTDWMATVERVRNGEIVERMAGLGAGGLRVVLGSASPRRLALLEGLGFEVEVRLADSPTDETVPEGLPAMEVAAFVAERKMEALLPLRAANEVLVTADTVVVCREKALGKPADRAEALEMLRLLSGQTHTVVTGVVMASAWRSVCFSDCAFVRFRPLEEAEIAAYVDVCRPYDKAGGYGIQEWIGLAGVSELKGSFTTVMGLPTHRVFEELRQFGEEWRKRLASHS